MRVKIGVPLTLVLATGAFIWLGSWLGNGASATHQINPSPIPFGYEVEGSCGSGVAVMARRHAFDWNHPTSVHFKGWGQTEGRYYSPGCSYQTSMPSL